jgi:hypothetical protein
MARAVVECDGCGKRLQVARRYQIARLADYLNESLNSACIAVGLSGTTQQDARCHGVTRRVADTLADRVGQHVWTIWPETADHDIEDHSVPCQECGDPFIPNREGHRHCSDTCRTRRTSREYQRRRHATDPEFREHKRRQNREYYEETVEYQRAYARRRYQEINGSAYKSDRYWNVPGVRERRLERQRERYWNNPDVRERERERHREYRAKKKAERESA